MKANPNDSAYPTEADSHGGLTKRELFGAMFLQGMLSSAVSFNGINPEHYSGTALILADALINELNKEQ